MNKLQCIIIEDEKPAQDVLISHISKVDSIELKAIFDDALAALDYLKTADIDLIFLDIQIPSLNGMDFLKVIRNPPQVIITSAYSVYAMEAFDLDVRDYLMKPFSFERFLKAMGRVAVKPDHKQVYHLGNFQQPDEAFAFFNVNKTMVRVRFREILYIESMREYVYIHTIHDKVITKIGIGEMEKMLGEGFLRTHRSFLVNKEQVTAYNAEEVFIQKQSIPVGGNYKKLVAAALAG